MRKPRKEKCPKSKRYPNGVKFYGSVEYRGRQKWVGTFATRDEWNEAANQMEAVLRQEWGGPHSVASVPTVAEFLGVRVADGGRVEPRLCPMPTGQRLRSLSRCSGFELPGPGSRGRSSRARR
jgi:hypothetical protein